VLKDALPTDTYYYSAGRDAGPGLPLRPAIPLLQMLINNHHPSTSTFHLFAERTLACLLV